MSNRTRIRIGRTMAAIGIVSTLTGWAWIVGLGLTELLVREWLIFNGFLSIISGLLAWTVLPRQPRNRAIWPFAIVTVTAGVFCLVSAWAFQLLADLDLELATAYALTPSEMPAGTAFVLMMLSWLFIPFVLLLTVALVLFPDGQPPSPRWRWTVWVAYGGVVVQSLAVAWLFRPSSTRPYETAKNTANFISDLGPVVGLAEVVTTLLIPICVVGMVVRFRRSAGDERQQFRVVVWGAGLGGVLVFVATIGDLTGALNPRWIALLIVFTISGSYAVAITKYRLYDVDVVISRSFVYGTLALFIAAVYVGIVVGVATISGTQDEPNVWLSVFATVVIALAFQPLRRWLQKVANRIVYGRRATPYEVLSSFSQGMDAADPDVLGQVAESLTEGTTSTAASIWVERGGRFQRIASWPEPDGAEDSYSVGDRIQDITHDGDRLGVISLVLPPGQPFPPADDRLLEQVASGLGLTLRNLQLTDDLQSRVDQLRESRRRIVAVQDETRRALERDLHDGAQQRLVALKIKVGIGESMAEKQGLDDVSQILSKVKEETDLTVDSLRTLARGIYPPLLEAEGLGPALTTQLHRMPVPIAVQAAGVGRHPREIESTVYFCVLEAVQNTIKHARASSALVSITDTGGHLRFEVRDDGVGFFPDQAGKGQGLTNITDRLDAVEGRLEIESQPGRGTVVSGRVPVHEVVTT